MSNSTGFWDKMHDMSVDDFPPAPLDARMAALEDHLAHLHDLIVHDEDSLQRRLTQLALRVDDLENESTDIRVALDGLTARMAAVERRLDRGS